MKKFKMAFTLLAFTCVSAFAQDYLSCNLTVRDNEPDCPFIGKCPQRALKTSGHKLFLELNEGDLKEGRIEFKKVIVLNRDDKEKEDVNLTIFSSDERPAQLKKSKNLKSISNKSKSYIDYSVQKSSNQISILLKSQIYDLNLTIVGDGKIAAPLFTENNMVYVACEKLNKSVYEEIKNKKEAIQNFKKEQNALSSKSSATKQ